ncbi:hypothetical protein AJ80_05896 [Polytolypa hystricis UAMH7299]|uniref:DUF4211 domain-containing protein n=1 Tax=Polytolypa hystricis (strain UAMH7299) TaxID=1447883 RepID=A0A2B7Y096_POLH7|nr:hypothetical protein AJ80_05896 [Polytolypa hystricis UAMH7299]
MGRATRRKSVKRQSRLAFTPVASSSPGIERSPGSEKAATLSYGETPKSSVWAKPIPKPPAIFTKEQPSSDQDSDQDSDEESVRAPSSARRAVKRALIEEDDDDDDEEFDDELVISSPIKRRRRNIEQHRDSSSPPRNRDEQDRHDLEEDLEDLHESTTMKTRTRGRAVDSDRAKRQQQLEMLRRRRKRDKSVEIIDSSSASGSEEADLNGSDQEEEPEKEGEWYGGIKQQDSDIESALSEDLDEYDKDFVEDDENGELGVPDDLADMPLEFTRHRYKRLSDHFRDVVEWMVHNKLNPAFPRDHAVYKIAFAKVNDEVMGLAGSQLISSAWNVNFKRALEARPNIEITTFPTVAAHSCDACNRSGHPASFDLRFDGKPYLLETLEPVTDDDSSDEEDSDESEEPGNFDREGNPIPDETTHFYLGRHCKSNATRAHTLIHWRFHLNEWIIDYLKHKGIFDDSRIIEREHWSLKRREKYANEVVDTMDEVGEVKKLWKDFNTNLKAARETKVSVLPGFLFFSPRSKMGLIGPFILQGID